MALVAELMAAGSSAGEANQIGQDAPATALTATGSTQGTALVLTSSFSVFGTVASSTGCILPVASGSQEFCIYNGGANALSVYPATGQTINNSSANTAFSVTNGKSARFMPAGTQWIATLSA